MMSDNVNVLTFDIEEWFHLLDYDDTRTEDKWSNYEVRIHKNVDRILDILEESGAKASFFIIGWIAKKYPEIVKKISEKYHVGTHTMNHQLVWQQSKSEFEKDVEFGIKILEDIAGKPVNAFRAPGFSIRNSEAWAFDVLQKYGIKYDCSVFPSKHAHGGMPVDGVDRPFIVKTENGEIKEFPVSVKNVLGKRLIFSGGGYFRLCPYFLVRKWARQSAYNMSYIHPRDLDAGQPVLKGLSPVRRFKSYCGLSTAESKLRAFVKDFNFTDIPTADAKINWASASKISF